MSFRQIVVALVVVGSAVMADDVDAVRIYSVRDACFPYVFTGISGRSPKGDVLAFNHLSRKTEFAAVGEELPGAYRVTAVEKRTRREFNPTVNAEQEKPAHRVTLRGPTNEVVVLEQGKPLKTPGLMACVVVLKTGGYSYVMEGHTSQRGDSFWRVIAVSNTLVVATSTTARATVVLATDQERVGVEALWQRQREVREEQRRMLAAKRRETAAEEEQQRIARLVKLREEIVASAPPVARGSSSTTFNLGTEYRYPAAWEVIPIWGRDRNGRRFLQQVTVPTRFETRSTGFSTRRWP